jgi:O-antigen ligase
MTDSAFSQYQVENRAATIAGDYHNGPLSVIIPFGIWGVLAFLWFLIAGVRVLWRNYRHGDLELRILNTYLLSTFLVSIITFTFVFGAISTGLVAFTGVLGLSVALNGGVATPPPPARFVSHSARKKAERGMIPSTPEDSTKAGMA